MGTTISLKVITACPKAEFTKIANSVFQNFEKIETQFSRFRENSEISRLNQARGIPFPASEELFTITEHALKLAVETEGAFDPTVLNSLIAEGYQSDFETLEKNQSQTDDYLEPVDFRSITLEPESQTIILAENVALDLGGIVKGYAVDCAVKILTQKFQHFLINAGGDIYLAGKNLVDEPWRVGIEHPTKKGTLLATLAVSDRAVATSGSYKRRWKKGNSENHHIIDPKTGHSAKNELVSVTVINQVVETADSLATAIFVLGAKKGLALAKNKKVECLLATQNLKLLGTPGIEKYIN